MEYLDLLPIHITCGISFSSDWYYHNAGISMAEDILRNPSKKHDAEIKRVRYQEQRYPDIFMPSGIPRDESSIKPGLGYGVTTLAAAMGARVRFDPHLDPTPVPTVDISTIDIMREIKKPDIRDALRPVFDEIDAYVAMGYKREDLGFPNTQGPLNIALETFGDRQMLSLISRASREEHARHILDVTSDVFIEATHMLHEELRRPKRGRWTVAGCTYVYLSPKQWTKFVPPVVHKCVDALGPVGLHHCGKADNEQVNAYGKVEWQGLEFGFGTDIAHVRKAIVNKKLGVLEISCRVSPYRMLNQGAAQVTKDVEWLIEKGKGGPQRIAVVGCPYGTPDENVYALWKAVQDFNKRKEEELEGE